MLAKGTKYLGAEIGFFSILHILGQNLMYHPYVHLVVTGGELTVINTCYSLYFQFLSFFLCFWYNFFDVDKKFP